jgi:hypothetical protein
VARPPTRLPFITSFTVYRPSRSALPPRWSPRHYIPMQAGRADLELFLLLSTREREAKGDRLDRCHSVLAKVGSTGRTRRTVGRDDTRKCDAQSGTVLIKLTRQSPVVLRSESQAVACSPGRGLITLDLTQRDRDRPTATNPTAAEWNGAGWSRRGPIASAVACGCLGSGQKNPHAGSRHVALQCR